MNSTRIPPTILSVRRLGTTLDCHLDVAGVASLSENYFKRKTIFLDIAFWFSFFLAWIHARLFISVDQQSSPLERPLSFDYGDKINKNNNNNMRIQTKDFIFRFVPLFFCSVLMGL